MGIHRRSSCARVCVCVCVGSMLIDAVGLVTYLAPGLGEAVDVVWAPISGVLIYLLYGNLWVAGAG